MEEVEKKTRRMIPHDSNDALLSSAQKEKKKSDLHGDNF
jgi:hypothetical protein